MNSKFSCSLVAILFLIEALPALADSSASANKSERKEQKLDFRKSIAPKVGVAGGGCEIGTIPKVFSVDEECQNIKNKISYSWNKSDNQALKDNLADKSVSCIVALNGAGSIIELHLRQNSGSAQLDKGILEFLRNLSQFQINKTWELKQHEYVVELPEVLVKPLN
jgi:hypothetical protein